MKLSNWIVISLALALTASLVVARTWSQRLHQERGPEAQVTDQRTADGLDDPVAAVAVQPEPPPRDHPDALAAQSAPEPGSEVAGPDAPIWTVLVVRGQQVEEVHYLNPYPAAPR